MKLRKRERGAVLLEAMMGAALLAIGLTALLVPMSALTHTRVHQRALMGAIGVANEMAEKHRPPAADPTDPVAINQPAGMPAFEVDVDQAPVGSVTRMTVKVSWTEGLIPRKYEMVTHVAN
jgi:hypothetical protein